VTGERPGLGTDRVRDQPRPEDGYSVFDGLGLVLWAQLAALVVAVPARSAGLDLAPGTVSSVLVVAIQVLTLAGTLAWLRIRGGLAALGGPVRAGAGHVAGGIVAGLVGFGGVTALLALADRLAGPIPPPEQGLMDASLQGGLATVVAVASAVVLAPVVEEAIHRGVLFVALRRVLGLVGGMLLSGGVFALVHVELAQPAYLFALLLLGVWFAAVRHRTGTLVASIVAHGTFNAVSIGVAWGAG
jgi:uncharacterized protein